MNTQTLTQLQKVAESLKSQGYTTFTKTENYEIFSPPNGSSLDTLPLTLCYGGKRAGSLLITDREGVTKCLKLIATDPQA